MFKLRNPPSQIYGQQNESEAHCDMYIYIYRISYIYIYIYISNEIPENTFDLLVSPQTFGIQFRSFFVRPIGDRVFALRRCILKER